MEEDNTKKQDTAAANTEKRIRFKLSLLGIELEATGYPSEELATVMQAVTSKLNLILLIMILALVTGKIPDWMQAAAGLFHNTG